MSYRLSRRASREIERTERWWRENRPASPDALVDEIAIVIEQVVTNHESGSPWVLPRVMIAGISTGVVDPQRCA